MDTLLRVVNLTKRFGGLVAVNDVSMDINLGEGMDGLMLTKMIRNMPKYTQTPIIAITAYAMQNDKDECINAGCSDYITKPFTKEILLNIISQYIP